MIKHSVKHSKEKDLHQSIQNGEVFISAINEGKVYSCISSSALREGLIRYLSPQAFIVYLFLIAHYNTETGESFPSYNTIRRQCALGTNVIQRALVNLQEMGLISIYRSNGTRQHHIYKLHAIEVGFLYTELFGGFDYDDDDDELTEDEQCELLDSLAKDEEGEVWDIL